MRHIYLYTKLWANLTQLNKFYLTLLPFFTVLVMLLEALTIASLFSFINTVMTTDSVQEIPQELPIFLQYLHSDNNIRIGYFTILVIVLASFSGLGRLWILYFQTRVANVLGLQIGVVSLARLMNSEYEEFYSLDKSEMISVISKKIEEVINRTILSLINFLTNIILGSGLLIVMLVLNFKLAVTLITVFAIFYILMFFITRKYLANYSVIVARLQDTIFEILNRSFDAFTELKVRKMQSKIVEDFYSTDWQLRKARINTNFIAGSPRIALESIAITIVCLLIYFLDEGKSEGFIATLMTFGVTSQKLLPLVQQSYQSIAYLQGNAETFKDVIGLLPDSEISDEIKTDASKLEVENDTLIKFENVSFKYNGASDYLFRNINLSIHRGDKVLIQSPSGQGKTTLIRLMMGLVQPTEGKIYAMGRTLTTNTIRDQWFDHFSYIPQDIYIRDTDITDNILFGSEELDHKKFDECIRIACLRSVLNDQKESRCRPGQTSMKMSGGQKQRVAIARALYIDKSILFCDEMTSALDKTTSDIVLNEINGLNTLETIICISHDKNIALNTTRKLVLKNQNLIEE